MLFHPTLQSFDLILLSSFQAALVRSCFTPATMSSCKTIIVALLTVSSVLAAPHFKLVTRAAPKLITGPASSYPAMSTWVDFNTTVRGKKWKSVASSLVPMHFANYFLESSPNTPLP